MYKMVICDDELIQRKILKKYLIKIFEREIDKYEILEFNSGEKLLNNYPDKVNIIFLDIHMGLSNGMDVARKIRAFDEKVEIIFVTVIVDYIQDGYEVNAYRYLLKPIKYDELERHVLNCLKKIRDNLEKFIVVTNNGEINKIFINDITYIEIDRKNLTIHTRYKDYKIRKSIGRMELELEKHNFFRCHKSFLVNLKQIECLKEGVISIYSDNIPVSKHKLKKLKDKLSYVLEETLC